MILKKSKGYATLLSVLVLVAIGTSATISLLLLGLGSSKNGFALIQSNQAKGLANACIENALEQIRLSVGYAGSGNLTVGAGSCNYTVINLGGNSRQIIATGLVGTITRKVKVTVNQIIPIIIISSWQELADF